ncbi:MAG: radical SAM protein [Planctomycetaceae bacterium]
MRAAIFRKRFPLAVVWNITYRCNCSCRYCGTSEMPAEELVTPQALSLMDDLAEMGTRWLTFSGGDPFMRVDLGQLVRRARHHKMHLRISTNGILLPDRISEVQSADAVSVSLDGPAEVHDAVRGNGTFRGALAGIEACKTANIKVNLKCTLGSHNLTVVDQVLEMARQLHLPVMFQPATSWLNFTSAEDPMAAEREAYRRAVEYLLDRKREGAPILNSAAGLRYLANWPEPADIPCFAGKLFCSIGPDGSFVACSTFQDAGLKASTDRSGSTRERFERASAAAYNCRQCWCAPLVEFNLALSMHAGAVLNALKVGL